MTAFKRTGIYPGAAVHSILNHTHDLDVVKSTGALDRKFWYLYEGTPTEGVGLRLASAGLTTPDNTVVSAKDILEIRTLYSGGSPELGYLRVKGLIVDGENTIVFHEEMQVADNLIILNSNLKPSTPPEDPVPPDSEGGGFHILRGNEDPARLQWIEEGMEGADSYWGITKGDCDDNFSEIVRYKELAHKTAPTFIGDDKTSYSYISPDENTLYSTLHALDTALTGFNTSSHPQLTLTTAAGTTVATLLSLNVNLQELDVAKPTTPYKVWATDPTTTGGSPKYPSWQTLTPNYIRQIGAALHLALFDTSNTLNHLVSGIDVSPLPTARVVLSSLPLKDRVYTINTSIPTSDFVMTEGVQSINGVKTFQKYVEFDSYLSFPRPDDINVSYYNIYPGALTRNEVLNFILPNGYPSTSNGSIGFSFDVMSSNLQLTYSDATPHNAVTIKANTGTPIEDGAQHLLTIGGDSGQEINLAKYGAANKNLVFATQDVGGATTRVPIFRSLVVADLPSFTAQYLILADATGKLNTQYSNPQGKYTQILVGENSSNTTYTIPSVGTNANFILSEGTQDIHGVKTFYGQGGGSPDYSIVFGAAAAASRVTAKFQTGTSSHFVGLKAPESSATITYILPTAPANEDRTFILKGSKPSSGVSTMSWIELPDLSSLHAAVTLDNNAKNLLTLAGQEIGVKTTTKNKFWATPSTGAGNLTPNFRTIALSDIVDITSASTFAASVGTDTSALTYLTSHSYIPAESPFDLQTVLQGIDSALNNAGLGVVATYMTKKAGEPIAIGSPLYLKNDGKVWKTSAGSLATSRFIGIATHNVLVDEDVILIIEGETLMPTEPGWTPGQVIYLGKSSGTYTTDISGFTSEDCIVKVGIAASDKTLFIQVAEPIVIA